METPFTSTPSNDDGELTKESKEYVLNWLNRNWTMPMTCSVCGEKKWIIAGHIVTSPIYLKGEIEISRTIYPQVMVICKNCGYTFYLNAVKIGLVASKGKKDA